MRITFILLLLFAGIICWQRWDDVKEYTGKSTEELRKYVLGIVQKPEDKQVIVVAPPEDLPPVPPQNVYYTLDRIEYPVKPFGVRAFEVGTPVRKVGEGNGKFVVEAGVDRAIVDPVRLTREPREIARVMKLAGLIEYAVKPGEAPRAEIEQLDRKIKALVAEKEKATEQVEMDRKSGRRSSNFMGPDPLFLQNEIDRYTAQKHALETNVGGRPQPLVQTGTSKPD